VQALRTCIEIKQNMLRNASIPPHIPLDFLYVSRTLKTEYRRSSIQRL
jgi:hypothetical protein